MSGMETATITGTADHDGYVTATLRPVTRGNWNLGDVIWRGTAEIVDGQWSMDLSVNSAMNHHAEYNVVVWTVDSHIDEQAKLFIDTADGGDWNSFMGPVEFVEPPPEPLTESDKAQLEIDEALGHRSQPVPHPGLAERVEDDSEVQTEIVTDEAE